MNLCVDLTISLAHYLTLPLIIIPATLSTQREPRRSERPYVTWRNQSGSIHGRQSERLESRSEVGDQYEEREDAAGGRKRSRRIAQQRRSEGILLEVSPRDSKTQPAVHPLWPKKCLIKRLLNLCVASMTNRGELCAHRAEIGKQRIAQALVDPGDHLPANIDFQNS